MTKKSILSYIRRSNPELLELKFGCEIRCKNYNEIEEGIFISKGSYKNEKGFRLFDIKKQDEIITEIIGSEVQLNHLLRAIEQVKLTFPSTHHEHKCLVIGMYDNSKSVEQNLDNPELCEFLYKLLIK